MNYLVENFISPEVKSQIEAVSKAVSEMADALSKLESVQKGISGGTGGGKNTKTAEFNAATEAEKRLTKATNELAIAKEKLYQQVLLKRNETKKQVQALSEELGITNKTTTAKKQKVKATIEETVSMQSRNQVAKLHAILSSQETTALQKLDAQMRLLNLDLQKMVSAGKTQNAEYIQKMATMKRLSNEYDKIAKASGTYAQKSMSAYGATFSLTQVMRELPNFAISSRIGFMALSNNLPLLTEDFTRLSQQIDVNTGKVLGFGGALKIFAKSLLSLNTIMIVASTLLILFGDDIGKFISKLFKASKEVYDFNDAVSSMVKVLDENSGIIKENREQVLLLGVMIERFKKEGDSADAIIKKYNETLGKHHGVLEDINSVMDAYAKYAEKYIDWSIRMEAATMNITIAAEARNKALGSEIRIGQIKGTKDYESLTSGGDEATIAGKIEASSQSIIQRYIEENRATMPMDKIYENLLKTISEEGEAKDITIIDDAGGREGAISGLIKDLERFYGAKVDKDLIKNLVLEYQKLYLSEMMYKEALDKATILLPEQYVEPETQGGGGSGATQSAKEQLEKLKMFSDERVQLLKRNNDIERDMQERSFTNEKQSFEDRLSATTEYIANLYRINKIETDMRIASANQDYDIEVKKVQKIRQENAKKLANGKITIKEYQKSEAQNIDTLERMTENHYVDLAKIISDGELNVQAIQKQSDEKVLNLKKEHLNDLKEETDYFRDQELRRLNQAEQNAMANMKRYSFEENLVNSLFGVKKDNEIAMFQVQQNYAEARYQENKSALERQIIDTRNKGLDTLDLQKQLSDLEIEEEERKAQALIEIQNRVNDKLSELNKQMQENLIQAAQVAWDKSFERYFNQLDEKSEKFKKIEEEELQTIKDKEKAGVLTKEEADKRKEQSAKYYQSVQDQIDRDREKAERRKFLAEQAFALGQVAINTALGVSKYMANPATALLVPVVIAAGVTQGAIIAAQTIPYFAEGGVMEHTGLAVLGDGGKSELALTPQGKFFLTSNQPELHRLEKGTRIYPDASKVDINKVLSMHRGSSVAIKDDKVYNELKQTNKLLKTQKSVNFYGMPLIRQIQQGEYISQRKRGLLN